MSEGDRYAILYGRMPSENAGLHFGEFGRLNFRRIEALARVVVMDQSCRLISAA
jgi:hypothetical protein